MVVHFLQLTVELTIGFFALLVITKALGKTQINQLTPFDFISSIVMGELVGNAIYDDEIGLHYILYAVTLWAVLVGIVERITQKKKETRSMLEGKPAIVIREGQLDYDVLRRNRLDLNQLQHLLRDKDVFSMQDVHYAILEANGTVNVMKKPHASSALKTDVKVDPGPPSSLPLAVILDGEWVEDNITESNISKRDVLERLQTRNIPDINRVLYAEWSGEYPLYIVLYDEPGSS
ncbi:DUF421 domain-containing protein [Salibacterium halotolerans]|uniref:Uncharacterized membrane protein YcaP, DUF421 family n=1 Tax=Salibacterium halotolerans TaxID=1884432 RepID=A0A1I5NV88_9BACI|nr:DUF421 domain-containing protein [Salibacterium halotolerans]SFP25683.1 Uncharacterized membrane protein YcaP, DUF421 family [Salibacterium halotolerans]